MKTLFKCPTSQGEFTKMFAFKMSVCLGVLAASAASSFAACSHNQSGDFAPFNGKTINVGTKKISITAGNPGEEVVTIEDLGGTVHVRGGKEARLIEVLDSDYNRTQIICE